MKIHDCKYCLVLNSLTIPGGVELRTLEFARFLREQGREPEILVLRESGPVREKFETEGFPVHVIPVYIQNEKEFRLLPLGMCRLWMHLMKSGYGLVLGLIPPSSYLVSVAMLPKRRRGLVIMEREALRRISRFYRVCNALINRIVDWRVCVSHFVRDRLLATTESCPNKVITIENGTALDEQQGSEAPWREKLKGQFVFGSLGRLEPVKAPDTAIRAFAQLRNRFPEKPMSLVIVGSGSLTGRLEDLIRELRLDDHVHLTGFQEYPQDFYGLFDAFLMPSNSEGLGTAWIEAMAHSVPVIASNLRPLSDYIHHQQNGLLFEPASLSALVEEMQRLLENAELRQVLSQAGRKTFDENFQREQQMRKLFETCEMARTRSTGDPGKASPKSL